MSLEDMKMSELRSLAKEKGINSYGMKKKDLIEALSEDKPEEPIKDPTLPDYKEQFVSPERIGDYLLKGYEKAEMDIHTGHSVPASVRNMYRSDVLSGRLIYMQKKI